MTFMNEENNCLFCKIIKGDIPSDKVYEDELFYAFLDIKPINLGHSLIVPKKHFENIFEIDEEYLEKLGEVIQKVSKAVKAGTNADAINIGMNNGQEAGQIIMHAHIHIIPRFKDDGLQSWGSKEVSNEDLSLIAKKIKNFI